MNISDLEARLKRLEAIEAIRHLEAQYCDLWDSSNAKGWAELFTEDAKFIRADVAGLPGHQKVGRVELENFCKTLQQGWGRFHMLTTVDIVVETDETARSRIGFICEMMRTGEYPTPMSVTGYYDTYYRLEEQGWLIEQRVERQIFKTETSYYGVFDPAMPFTHAGEE